MLALLFLVCNAFAMRDPMRDMQYSMRNPPSHLITPFQRQPWGHSFIVTPEEVRDIKKEPTISLKEAVTAIVEGENEIHQEVLDKMEIFRQLKREELRRLVLGILSFVGGLLVFIGFVANIKLLVAIGGIFYALVVILSIIFHFVPPSTKPFDFDKDDLQTLTELMSTDPDQAQVLLTRLLNRYEGIIIARKVFSFLSTLCNLLAVIGLILYGFDVVGRMATKLTNSNEPAAMNAADPKDLGDMNEKTRAAEKKNL